MNYYSERPQVPTFQIQNPRGPMYMEIVRHIGKKPQFPCWDDENNVRHSPYDEVADWLTNTKGKGLMLIGDCGLGKTILGQLVVPELIHRYSSYVTMCFDAMDLTRNPKEVMRYRLVMVDDIGTETPQVVYGRRHDYFPELVDQAEKKGKFLILTSNLSLPELTERYGQRTVDRLRALTRCVIFRGKSLRE